MIGRLCNIVYLSLVLPCITNCIDLFAYNNTERSDTTNETFKDYIDKFKPSNVWKKIEETNKVQGLNKTFKDEFDKILNMTDETDELLSLKVENGEPKVLLHKDGRKNFWKPTGDIISSWHDPFSIRFRLYELMKQAVYQSRNKMVLMQILRKKYNKISLYKMGYLFSKADNACKTFASFAFKSFKACTMSRQEAIETHPLFDVLEANERLLSLWFDVDLIVDLIVINNNNCKRMLNQVMTNRKHAWKFFD